jgi:hypothetical protein
MRIPLTYAEQHSFSGTPMQTIEKLKDTDQPKKTYSSPEIRVYGTVEKMTLNVGSKGSLDNGGGGAAGPKTR